MSAHTVGANGMETKDLMTAFASGESSPEAGERAEKTILDKEQDSIVSSLGEIGGYLWKFPSEGSNTHPESNESEALEIFPRKCRYCARAWVSSYSNERQHWRKCGFAKDEGEVDDQVSTSSKLGVPRRVWCEVDAALTHFQWRMDADSTQDFGNCAVRLDDIAEVVLLDTPANSFRIHTALGRQIVFQYRGEDDQGHEQTRYNASQWCDYLQTISEYARGNEERTENRPRQEDTYFHEVSTKAARRQELLQHMTHAINKNDVSGLKELLGIEQRSNNDLRDTDGNSLLGMALKAGANKDIVEALIEARVNCNAQNNEGESPLLLAAASGDLEILRLLLGAEKIDVNQRCKMGTSAVHAAANAGEAAALQQLCDTGADLSATDDVGWTAMHYAAVCDSGFGPLRLLCELVPELIDSQCAEGNTALHIAAGYGCEDNVRALLETAANPHILNYDKQTAYHVALHNNHVACAVAIHEYMDTPRDVYELSTQAPRAVSTEETRSAELPAGRVAACEYESYTFSAWIRATTEDGLEYFYNSITGESTWHRPDELDQNSAQPPPAPSTLQHSYVDEIFSFTEPGQKLPLCMIPLVSPLVSLDDPTAATKLDAQRKKARERRRSKVSKQRQRSHSSDPSSDPVQSVDTTSGYAVS